MNEESSSQEKWYTRPVFSVSAIEAALGYYCGLLGFEQAWKYEEGGISIVTQVNKGEFELILTANLDRVGVGRVFVSLTDPEMKRFRDTVRDKSMEAERIHWGYPAYRLKDPDGNEMILPYEDEG